MSKTFYMRTLGQFLDNLCLNNFGWFYSSLGRGGAMTYMAQWDMDMLAARLLVSCLINHSTINIKVQRNNTAYSLLLAE